MLELRSLDDWRRVPIGSMRVTKAGRTVLVAAIGPGRVTVTPCDLNGRPIGRPAYEIDPAEIGCRIVTARRGS